MEPAHYIANPGELAYAQCACVLSAAKMADRMYGHPREGVLDSTTEEFQRKRHKFFDLCRPLSA